MNIGGSISIRNTLNLKKGNKVSAFFEEGQIQEGYLFRGQSQSKPVDVAQNGARSG